jgi:hypothetical protein
MIHVQESGYLTAFLRGDVGNLTALARELFGFKWETQWAAPLCVGVLSDALYRDTKGKTRSPSKELKMRNPISRLTSYPQ